MGNIGHELLPLVLALLQEGCHVVEAEGKLLKNKIAHEKGIPLELAGRLIGTTEEELTKDAESMAGFFAPPAAPPLRSNAPSGQPGADASLDAAYATLLASLTPNT